MSTKDSLFDLAIVEVQNSLSGTHYSCSYDRDSKFIRVYGCFNPFNGRMLISAAVIKTISMIARVSFISVSVDADGKLVALFQFD